MIYKKKAASPNKRLVKFMSQSGLKKLEICYDGNEQSGDGATSTSHTEKSDQPDITTMFSLDRLLSRERPKTERGTVLISQLTHDCIVELEILGRTDLGKFKEDPRKGVGVPRSHKAQLQELKEELAPIEAAIGLLSIMKAWAPTEAKKVGRESFELLIKSALMQLVPKLAHICFDLLVKSSPPAAALLIYHEHACQQLTADESQPNAGVDTTWDSKEQLVFETYMGIGVEERTDNLFQAVSALQDYRAEQNMAMKTKKAHEQILSKYDSQSVLNPSPRSISRRRSSFEDSKGVIIIPLSDLLSNLSSKGKAGGMAEVVTLHAKHIKKPAEDFTEQRAQEHSSYIATLNIRLQKIGIDRSAHRNTGFTRYVREFSDYSNS